VIWSVLLASLAALSVGLLLWQVVVAARFPLHRRATFTGIAPAITLLKPLKGCDTNTRACLKSWLTQDYPGPVQVLFGVASAKDPVNQVVLELMAEYPSVVAQRIICDETLGPNAKVSQLVQLEPLAEHDLICISDADVWVPPDFLRSAVGPMRDPAVGLVNAFYRIAPAQNLAMRWEAFAVNADFWSQVLQSLSLKPMDFALGAAMLTSRRHLASVGGFGELLDQLADDYQLGNRLARTGVRIELCPVVVECHSDSMGFREVWAHQLRWARTVRACRPGPFFLSVLSNSLLWPLVWFAAFPSGASLIGATCSVLLRMLAGAWLERRLTGQWQMSSCAMALVKDSLQLVLWLMAFTGNRVNWRGINYRVEAGGRLVQYRSADINVPSASPRL
jgi:ceramide glucosyltransferase